MIVKPSSHTFSVEKKTYSYPGTADTFLPELQQAEYYSKIQKDFPGVFHQIARYISMM